MADVFFILKCFLLSVLIVFSLQFKINNMTIEHKLTASLRNTSSHRWLADMGMGAVNFSREMYAQALGHPKPHKLNSTSSYPEESIDLEQRDVASQIIPLKKVISDKETKKFKELDAVSEGYDSQASKEPGSAQK